MIGRGRKLPRIVIVTNGNYFANLILSPIFKRFAEDIVGVLVITGDYKGRSGFHALWELGRVTAFPYLVYKIITYVAFDLAQITRPQLPLFVESQAKALGLPVARCVRVNSEKAYMWINALNPDLLISVSCPQLINRKLLSIPKLASLNIHSSLLPRYAGLAPYYWVLCNGEQDTGTTVHYMAPKFDAGNILVQKRIAIESGESVFHLFQRLAVLGGEALVEAIPLAREQFPGECQDLSKYSYFSNPTMASYFDLRKRGHCLFRVNEIWKAMWE